MRLRPSFARKSPDRNSAGGERKQWGDKPGANSNGNGERKVWNRDSRPQNRDGAPRHEGGRKDGGAHYDAGKAGQGDAPAKKKHYGNRMKQNPNRAA